MKYAWRIGKLAGIQVAVHWTFLLLIGWVIWTGSQAGQGREEIAWTVFFVLTLFGCVTLHELGHALAARQFNIRTLDITLLPIGGVARLEAMPEKPLQELWVAVAGPLVNVGIALLLFPFVWIQFSTHDLQAATTLSSHTFLLNLFLVNITLVIFNLIPAFPMDGGRIFRALLATWLPRHRATQVAARVGQLFAVGFAILGLMGNPFLIFIAFFIFMGAQAEAQVTTDQHVLSGFTLADVTMRQVPAVSPDDPLSVPVALLLGSQARNFLVVQGEIVVGTLGREELIRGLSESGSQATVRSVMDRSVPALELHTPLPQAYATLQQHGRALLPVVDQGRWVGAVDLENIVEFIMVRHVLNPRRSG